MGDALHSIWLYVGIGAAALIVFAIVVIRFLSNPDNYR